jgi:mRNA interferase HigB
MRVLNRELLLTFGEKHANAKRALDSWYQEAKAAAWQCPNDIKRRYPSADFLADNRVIFNIKGNHYRLVVKAAYQAGILRIEWVGTHAEYSKKTF